MKKRVEGSQCPNGCKFSKMKNGACPKCGTQLAPDYSRSHLTLLPPFDPDLIGLQLCFTGHRPDKLGGYGPSPIQTWVRERIWDALVFYKPVEVISGMALGVDQWATEEALDLGIPVTAAIPFVGQESQWPEASRAHYERLLNKCTGRVIVSPGGYTRDKLLERNRWMVNHSLHTLAVFDGSEGGTAHTVRYARFSSHPVTYIDPLLKTIRVENPRKAA